MSMLELVFPAEMLPQIDQQSHVFGSTSCSSKSVVGDMSRPNAFGQPRKRASPIFMSKDCLAGQKDYDGANDSPLSSCLEHSQLVTDNSNAGKLLKKILKKKNKRKKDKTTKKWSDNDVTRGVVVVASEACRPASESSSSLISSDHLCSEVLDNSNERKCITKPHKSTESDPTFAVTLPISGCEPMDEYLKRNKANYDGITSSELLSSENSERSQLLTHISRHSRNTGHEDNKISKVEAKEITSNSKSCCKQVETLPSKYLSHDKPHGTNGLIDTRSDVKREIADKGSGNIGGSSPPNVHSVTPSQNVEPDNKNSSSQTGKRRLSMRHKTHRSIRDLHVQSHGAKISNQDHMQMGVRPQDATPVLRHSSFSKDTLLPSPIITTVQQYSFVPKVKEVVHHVQGMHETHGNIFLQSQQWVALQRINGHLDQYVSQPRPDVTPSNKIWGRQKDKMSFNHYRNGNSNAKVPLYRMRNKTSQKELPEVSSKAHPDKCRTCGQGGDHFDCLPKDLACSSNVELNMSYLQTRTDGQSDQALFDEVQPHSWMKIPKTEVHASLHNEEKKPASVNTEFSYDHKIKQDFSSRISLQKWVPIGKKDSWTLKGNEADACNELCKKQVSCKNAKAHQVGSRSVLISEPLCSANSDITFSSANLEIENCPFHEIAIIKDKFSNYENTCKGRSKQEKNVSVLYIGSQMQLQTLHEAYRLQIASESIQLATGSPLAEFEKLLHLASPVILPASILRHCEECSKPQLIAYTLCKHQIPNIRLGAFWNWYEKPGSYGLEVQAQDSKNLKGLDAMVPFHAHFVPFLSAVQLFGHPRDSNCNTTKIHGSEISEAANIEWRSSSRNFSMSLSEINKTNNSEAEKVNSPVEVDSAKMSTSSSVYLESDGNDSSELIFEFFEHEQPQQRKPLYDKIMELTKNDNSNCHVFGDPSRLRSMNLRDLHPASWFSVAWYPIYRIPEGSFRASFLMYHSFGHLAQRCTSSDSVEDTFCVVSPVLGLQSYNAKGECWFYPKMTADSSLERQAPLDSSSQVLKERLRTLEENAFLFARGCVYKDQVKGSNHQPDYEFFLSRKH